MVDRDLSCLSTLGERASALGGRMGELGELMLTAPLEGPLAVAGTVTGPVREEVRRSVRRSLGVPGDPPPRVVDPEEAFLPPGGIARRVHADLPSMVVGGLAALLLQTLHPLAMAGVAEHSNYKEDAAGRLRRTAQFVGVTTFGSAEDAKAAIERVREIHRDIRGISPDGRPYSADDPDLLTWVHVAEMWCFLQAAQRYGPRRLTAPECDAYYAETAVVARLLGAEWVAQSADEVTAYFARVQPDLYAGPQALAARDFLLRGVGTRPNDRALHALIAGAAVTLLPGWARSALRIPAVPLVDGIVVAPVAKTFCAALRWMVAPPSARA